MRPRLRRDATHSDNTTTQVVVNILARSQLAIPIVASSRRWSTAKDKTHAMNTKQANLCEHFFWSRTERRHATRDDSVMQHCALITVWVTMRHCVGVNRAGEAYLELRFVGYRGRWARFASRSKSEVYTGVRGVSTQNRQPAHWKKRTMWELRRFG